MIDINYIINNKKVVLEKLANKNYDLNFAKFSDLYMSRKESIQKEEDLKAKLNDFNKKITKEKRKPTKGELSEIKKFSNESKDTEKARKDIELKLNELLLEIPNLHEDSVPIGEDASFNKEISRKGKIRDFDFKILDHVTLGTNLKLFDLEVAAKITGARFNLYRGLGAKLERALINFMLDEHSTNN